MTTTKEKKKSLFQIKCEYEEILCEIIEADGEVDESLYEKLNGIDMDLTVKAENYVYIIKKSMSEDDYIDAEIKRLEKRKKRNKNLINRLKNDLKNALERLGKTKLKAPLFVIRIQNNPPTVKVVDESLIPDEFKEERTTTHLKKTAMLQLLKDGEEVAGAVMSQSQSLRIA